MKSWMRCLPNTDFDHCNPGGGGVVALSEPGARTQDTAGVLNDTRGQRHKHSFNTTMLWTLKTNASLAMELRPGSATPFPGPAVSHFSQKQHTPSVTDSELASVQCVCPWGNRYLHRESPKIYKSLADGLAALKSTLFVNNHQCRQEY